MAGGASRQVARGQPCERSCDQASRLSSVEEGDGTVETLKFGTSKSVPPKTARTHRLGWGRDVEGTSDFGWERGNCLLHQSVGFAMVACGGKNRDSAQSGARLAPLPVRNVQSG